MRASDPNNPPGAAPDREGGDPRRCGRPASARALLSCGLLHGALTALSIAPFGLWPLALLALAPLAWAADRAGPRRTRAGLLVSTPMLGVWLWEQRWVADVTAPGYPLFALYLSIYPGLCVALSAWLLGARPLRRTPAWLIVATTWSGLEFARGEWVLGGYAWYLTGHPLIEWPALAGAGRVVGAYGVSALAACVGAACGSALSRPHGRPLVSLAAIAAAWLGLSALGGLGPGPRDPAPALRVGVVQTSVPQDNKNGWSVERRISDFRRFLELSRAAAANAGERPDVVIWPETMYPGGPLNPDAIEALDRAGIVWRIESGELANERIPATQLATLLRQVQASDVVAPMLVGATALEGLAFEPLDGGRVRERNTARRNSVFLLRDGRIETERYDKRVLTPMGEVIPLAWRWPAVQRWIVGLGAPGMDLDLRPGELDTVFTIPAGPAGASARLVTPICSEATNPWRCRALAYAGAIRRADVLVNLSNDGWFGRVNAGREHHLLAARWRCVELGIPMVRAVNTGLSAVIDPWGRIVRSGPEPNTDGVMVVDVPIPSVAAATIYGARVGDATGWASFGLTVAGLVMTICSGRAATRDNTSDPGSLS
ncbi:MAG: apolipoprotein N-acyltransferase [Phycisphaerae bacterium]|nr:apolipoprotein N-acyltransferase [Phycisphaerae bacterium]